MSDNKITISVSGANAVGKTHVIAAIQNMLTQNGFGDSVFVSGSDTSTEAYDEIMERVTNTTLDKLDLRVDLFEIAETYPKQLCYAEEVVESAQENTVLAGAPISHGEGIHDPVEHGKQVLAASAGVPLIPVWRPASAHYFVDASVFPPTDAVVAEGQDPVTTSFLKFGKSVDLLGISNTQALFDCGILDHTDSIDPGISLKQVAFDFNGTPVIAVVDNIALSTLAPPTTGNYGEVVANFQATLPLIDDERLTLKVTGTVNLEIGTAFMEAEVIECTMPNVPQYKLTPVGYSMNVKRVNHNRR